jgi:hypothetical protein
MVDHLLVVGHVGFLLACDGNADEPPQASAGFNWSGIEKDQQVVKTEV